MFFGSYCNAIICRSSCITRIIFNAQCCNFDYAIENDMIHKNYTQFIKIKKAGPEEKEAFNDLEIKKIEEAAATGIEWADVVLILIYTGFRISELLNLTIFNVDMDKQLITGGLKTDAGKNRTVPIHPKILQYVKKWYDAGGERLICLNKKPVSSRKFREDLYRPVLAKIGVRILDPHSCRHTFGTLLSKKGSNTKAIQELMGHADYALTANTYTHPDIEELRKAINSI